MSGKAVSTPVRIMHSRQSEIVEILTFPHYSKVHCFLRLTEGYLERGCKERLISLFLCGTMCSGNRGRVVFSRGMEKLFHLSHRGPAILSLSEKVT